MFVLEGGFTLALMYYCGAFLATVLRFPQQSILASTFVLFLGRLTVLRLCSSFYSLSTLWDLLYITSFGYTAVLGFMGMSV